MIGSPCIVVQGLTDAQLLRSFLPERQLKHFRFFAGQGRLSLTSLARNILVEEGVPVLIVMDAETYSHANAEESRSLTMAALRSASPTGLFDVFTFIPEIEVVLFEAASFLEKRLGTELLESVISQGFLAPKRTLVDLVSGHDSGKEEVDLKALIGEGSAEEIRAGKQATALLAAIDALLSAWADALAREGTTPTTWQQQPADGGS